MAWERISIELPTLDEAGNRPHRDPESGELRPVEDVPYESLKLLEFEINTLATVADRRWLVATLDNLAARRSLSTVYGTDFSATLEAVCARYVRGVRLDGNTEVKGEEATRGLADALEYDDAIVFLNWLRRKAQLTSAKKKNWRQQFGLPTSSTTGG